MLRNRLLDVFAAQRRREEPLNCHVRGVSVSSNFPVELLDPEEETLGT